MESNHTTTIETHWKRRTQNIDTHKHEHTKSEQLFETDTPIIEPQRNKQANTNHRHLLNTHTQIIDIHTFYQSIETHSTKTYTNYRNL